MKRTLTTEQLRERAEALRGEALGWADKGFSFESQRLSETAAALDELADIREAQPVGVMNIGSKTCSDYRVAWTKSGTQLGKGVHWLYTTPPTPAVPSFDEWLESTGTHPVGWVREVMEGSYNACRAAMLAAAPEGGNG
jgi:hypothetical protein